MIAILEEMLAFARAGTAFALVTVIETNRSTPRKGGAKMIVLEDGGIRGSVGGGALEAEAIQEALRLLRQGGSPLIRRYTLRREGDDAVGMYCGGEVHVLVEVFPPASRLLLFGAGHVSRAIARQARDLGFRIVIADDRPGFLNPAAFPVGCELLLVDREYRRDLPAPGPEDYAIIATRCHDTDEAVLTAVLGGPAAYVGMIASRAKAATILSHLRKIGMSEEMLAKVRSPMGLPIGSHTPAEVAISVLAEIISIRNARDRDDEEGRPAAEEIASSPSRTTT